MGDMGPKKLMSFEEFALVYDDTGELELLRGELIGPLGSAALPFPAGGIMDDMGTKTLMSFAEFELLDAGADDVELLRGELIRVPPPQRRHMEICERLFKLLDAALERWKRANSEAGIGELHIEMGYRVSRNPQSWLRPDLSLTHPGQPGERYYEGAPLVVFEVFSEYDTATRLDKKVADYLAHGAAEVWVIYPELRHAWVYRGAGLTTTRETEAIHSDLLPGIEIPLDEIL
jgi:Uma2 family endonuclease